MTEKEFKKIRLKLGLTQAKFAELLGYEVSATALRKENGHAPITRQDEIIIGYLLEAESKKQKT